MAGLGSKGSEDRATTLAEAAAAAVGWSFTASSHVNKLPEWGQGEGRTKINVFVWPWENQIWPQATFVRPNQQAAALRNNILRS